MIPRNQMELSFEQNAARRQSPPRRHGLTRARWWFAQMHRVVDEVAGLPPAPHARTQQILLRIGARN